jgi:hypothetical protein
MGSDWNAARVIKTLVEIIERGCVIKILFLKRYPTTAQLRFYGISREGDFFFMRERDEDDQKEFRRGRRLKIIANHSLGCLIEVLLELTRRTQDEDIDKRQEILGRLQLREYIALPSLSLYIIDEEIYVTPYLCKRHCSTVPAFQVGSRRSDLYLAYNGHFEKTWEEQGDSSAISEKFVQLLVNKPKETVELYARLVEVIAKQEATLEHKKPEYVEDPDHYRVQEKAIKAVVNQMTPRPSVASSARKVGRRPSANGKRKSTNRNRPGRARVR